MKSVKKYAPWVIAAICLMSAIWSWHHPVEIAGPPGENVYVDRTNTVYVKVPVPVENGEVQGTGNTLMGDPVVATANCPPSTAGSDVVSTVTQSTGEVHILVKPKERNLFGFEDSKELGIRANGVREGLYARWTFLRVGSFYGALYAEANTKPDTQIMLEVSYRW